MSKKRDIKPQYYNITYDCAYGADSQPLPRWNTYLYQLQQEAPHPNVVLCKREIPDRPHCYAKEYHGKITRDDAERLLVQDGCYLVRKSERAADAFTLAIRYGGMTKNFKLFYDGQHFVGDKKFDMLHDLVADGLITFHLETHAADFIASLCTESNYAESPYFAYSTKKKMMQSKTYSSVKKVAKDQTDSVIQELQKNEENLIEAAYPTNAEDYEKPHCFKTHNFIGLHWCDFCANFMWGLIAQGVKCQDCGFEAHKRCSEKVPPDCMPDMKYVKQTFGADLTTVVKAKNTALPAVVEKCVKEIESRGLKSEGLYRIAGFHDDIEAIKMAFDKDVEGTNISRSKYEDINTVTSVLKLYFRLLPIPAVSFETYKKLIEIVKKDNLDKSQKLTECKEAISLLPPAHFQTLRYLFSHLHRVTEQKATNMMGPENLAIVFSPTLMRSPDSNPMASLINSKFEQMSVELMITYHKQLFAH